MFRGRRHRIAEAFYRRPILPFALQFVILAPLVLANDPRPAAGAYVFLLPWLLLLFGIFNLPLMGAAFRVFRIDDATRRNHALEHATVHYIRAETGVHRISGKASRHGFRIGGAQAKDIRVAFGRVREDLRNGQELPCVSRSCGSNVVTALGFAVLLLTIVTLLSVLLQPPLVVRQGALAAVVLAFTALRHGVGNWVQRRWFLLVDFDDVAMRGIRKVPGAPLDIGPVHFIETIVMRSGSLADGRPARPA